MKLELDSLINTSHDYKKIAREIALKNSVIKQHSSYKHRIEL